jgi:hypothetical protein
VLRVACCALHVARCTLCVAHCPLEWSPASLTKAATSRGGRCTRPKQTHWQFARVHGASIWSSRALPLPQVCDGLFPAEIQSKSLVFAQNDTGEKVNTRRAKVCLSCLATLQRSGNGDLETHHIHKRGHAPIRQTANHTYSKHMRPLSGKRGSTGPRACSRPVEMPTSAPSPNRKPSANLEEALWKTHLVVRCGVQ